VNADATEYVLHVRKDVTWNNGDAFTADDVIYNLNRWADKKAAGNSMAARVNSLIDPATEKAREGAITKVDDHTVKLKLSESDIAVIANFTDYPGLIVHPLRGQRQRPGEEPDRHGSLRTGVLRCWLTHRGQAPRERQVVGRKPCSTASNSLITERSVGAGQRL
jgi:hypothetical protein